ncbi:MAG: hypothetical protein K2W92_09340, partial [Alphaproteobacteria bacterium]|nr:hypothetical protein [Alphaproteobacteria bacterium]
QAQVDAIEKLSVNLEDLDFITQYRNAKKFSSERRKALKLPTTKERINLLLKSRYSKRKTLSDLLKLQIFDEASAQHETLAKAKAYLDQLCKFDAVDQYNSSLNYLILEPTLNRVLDSAQRAIIFSLIHEGLKTEEALRDPEYEFLHEDLWPFAEGAFKGGGFINEGCEDRKVIFQNKEGGEERTFLRFWLFPEDSFFSAIQMGKKGFLERLICEGRKGQNAQKFRDVFKECMKESIQNSPNLINDQSFEPVDEQKFAEYITSLKNTDFPLFEAAEVFRLMIHQPITIWALSPDQKRAFPLDISLFKGGGLDKASVARGGLHLGLYNRSLQLLLEEGSSPGDINVAQSLEMISLKMVQLKKIGCNFPVNLVLRSSESMKIRQQGSLSSSLLQGLNQSIINSMAAPVDQSSEVEEN